VGSMDEGAGEVVRGCLSGELRQGLKSARGPGGDFMLEQVRGETKWIKGRGLRNCVREGGTGVLLMRGKGGGGKDRARGTLVEAFFSRFCVA